MGFRKKIKVSLSTCGAAEAELQADRCAQLRHDGCAARQQPLPWGPRADRPMPPCLCRALSFLHTQDLFFLSMFDGIVEE